MAELAILSSGAVLLLFVSVRNCFAAELIKLSMQTSGSGPDDAGAKLSAFLQAKENILKDIMSCMLKWILSSGRIFGIFLYVDDKRIKNKNCSSATALEFSYFHLHLLQQQLNSIDKGIFSGSIMDGLPKN